ncbi:hypothetical protein KI688_005532 [Linnemannia hyalina]|uniref:Uncharacterized protein n=1 Tax=Linnemannia hyalina TaxID=64524 RepID=A0A9P8BXJ7_9FUNG|nr:hypothetical protein KI688_005532 [Linnemannia hyalina]
MPVAPPGSQAIRSLNINKPTSTPPHPTEVVYIDIYTDPITKDKLLPFRIVAIPGEVLDIVVGNLQDTTPQQRHPSVLTQIEQQAARFPKHNPFSTMRPISSLLGRTLG